MLVHFVGQQDRYQLGDAGKDQISMKGLFVLCFPSGRAKRLFDMMDGAFYGCPYFICGLPFRCSAERAGISAQFFLRIGIDHPSVGGNLCRRYLRRAGFCKFSQNQRRHPQERSPGLSADVPQKNPNCKIPDAG